MAMQDPRFQGVLPPSSSNLKPGNAAIPPGGLQLPGGAASPTGLPQLSGEGAAPDAGAAGTTEGLQTIVQQLAQAIMQATGKPPTPQMLQAALMSLMGPGAGRAGMVPGGGAAGPMPGAGAPPPMPG